MNHEFYNAVKNRHSIYGISKETVVSDERIIETIEHAVRYSPSAFNSQTGRTVVLLKEQHNKLWDATKEILRALVKAEAFAQTEQKIDGFRNGYGTVLFFEEQKTIEELQGKFPTYKDNFPIWSLQSSGMLQYIVWTSLELEGFGASLQHYNPLIDETVKKEWNIPDSWKLIAQMPFGKVMAPAQEKEFIALEERIRIFK